MDSFVMEFKSCQKSPYKVIQTIDDVSYQIKINDDDFYSKDNVGFKWNDNSCYFYLIYNCHKNKMFRGEFYINTLCDISEIVTSILVSYDFDSETECIIEDEFIYASILGDVSKETSPIHYHKMFDEIYDDVPTLNNQIAHGHR